MHDLQIYFQHDNNGIYTEMPWVISIDIIGDKSTPANMYVINT